MKQLQGDFLSQYKIKLTHGLETVKDVDRQKLAAYTHIILTLLSVSFFGFFAINPTLSTISNLKRQYEDDSLVETSLTSKIKALSNLNTQYKTIQPDIGKINSAIPNTFDIPTFTEKVQELTLQDHLTLKSFEIAGTQLYPKTVEKTPTQSSTDTGQQPATQSLPIQNQNTISIPFNIGATGQKNDVNQFIADFINLDRILTFDTLNLSAGENGDIMLTISGQIYVEINQ